jgi:hypothetical protein
MAFGNVRGGVTVGGVRSATCPPPLVGGGGPRSGSEVGFLGLSALPDGVFRADGGA